jgi:hypothetical protein
MGGAMTKPGLIDAAANVDGLLPCDFLLAVTRYRYIVIKGQQYEPTAAERQ